MRIQKVIYFLVSFAFLMSAGCGAVRNDKVEAKTEEPKTSLYKVEQVNIQTVSGANLQVICDPKRGNLVYVVQGHYNSTNFESRPVAIAVIHQPDFCKSK